MFLLPLDTSLRMNIINLISEISIIGIISTTSVTSSTTDILLPLYSLLSNQSLASVYIYIYIYICMHVCMHLSLSLCAVVHTYSSYSFMFTYVSFIYWLMCLVLRL